MSNIVGRKENLTPVRFFFFFLTLKVKYDAGIILPAVTGMSDMPLMCPLRVNYKTKLF